MHELRAFFVREFVVGVEGKAGGVFLGEFLAACAHGLVGVLAEHVADDGLGDLREISGWSGFHGAPYVLQLGGEGGEGCL